MQQIFTEGHKSPRRPIRRKHWREEETGNKSVRDLKQGLNVESLIGEELGRCVVACVYSACMCKVE